MKQNNPKILSQLITNLSKNKSKQYVLEQIWKTDQKLSELYADTHDARQTVLDQLSISQIPHLQSKIPVNMSASTAVSLGIPKNNSLTDSLMRSTLGCEDKLAKSYLEILDDSEKIQQAEKQKRIQQAKQRFAASNKFGDIYANSRPQLHNSFNYTYHQYHQFSNRAQPVIDNQHQSYLKTQLMYIQKPKTGKKVNEKQYYDKHVDNVTRKIKQIGGMEDTVGSMEQSLGKYQLRNFKKRAVYSGWTGSNFNVDNNPFKGGNSKIKESGQTRNSWTDRSKAIRQALMTKLDIQQ